jgi:hypothetical protein
MSRTNKHKLVEEHLKKYGSITSWEAIANYDATRLSSIIFNLRKKGYEIETRDIVFQDRYGNTGTYAKYILKGE